MSCVRLRPTPPDMNTGIPPAASPSRGLSCSRLVGPIHSTPSGNHLEDSLVASLTGGLPCTHLVGPSRPTAGRPSAAGRQGSLRTPAHPEGTRRQGTKEATQRRLGTLEQWGLRGWKGTMGEKLIRWGRQGLRDPQGTRGEGLGVH